MSGDFEFSLFTIHHHLRSLVALRFSQYVKERANRTQSQACLNYAEVQPLFEVYLNERANRTQSRACLNYAEVQPLFEVYLKDRLVSISECKDTYIESLKARKKATRKILSSFVIKMNELQVLDERLIL